MRTKVGVLEKKLFQLKLIVINSSAGSGTEDSGDESDPNMPGLEGGDLDASNLTAAANAMLDEAAGKGKQSRSEKKARKAMSKLGLKPVSTNWTPVHSAHQRLANFRPLDSRHQPSRNPQVKEHSVCHQQTRRVQVTRQRYLHHLW